VTVRLCLHPGDVLAGYPPQYERELALRDGRRVQIRPIIPTDAAEVAILVDPAWRRVGLATALLDLIAQAAPPRSATWTPPIRAGHQVHLPDVVLGLKVTQTRAARPCAPVVARTDAGNETRGLGVEMVTELAAGAGAVRSIAVLERVDTVRRDAGTIRRCRPEVRSRHAHRYVARRWLRCHGKGLRRP
jgi:GNAT superfamily N-acetyltransferase